jgi:hypothetical protein
LRGQLTELETLQQEKVRELGQVTGLDGIVKTLGQNERVIKSEIERKIADGLNL